MSEINSLVQGEMDSSDESGSDESSDGSYNDLQDVDDCCGSPHHHINIIIIIQLACY